MFSISFKNVLQGNPGEFYSDADELLELKNKFGSLFELTTQLQQNFTSKQLQLEAELNAAKGKLLRGGFYDNISLRFSREK